MTSTNPENGTGTSVRRRDFIRVAAATGLATVLTESRAEESEAAKSTPKVCVYTEKFQSLPIPEVCRLFSQMGVDGLDVTVRPGGHIEPGDARVELSKAATAARDHGLKIMMLTTGITGPDRNAEEILATCRQLGISRIKLGYYSGGAFGTLAKRLDEVRRELDGVVKLAAKHEVRPCVHVHSGMTVPSNGLHVV